MHSAIKQGVDYWDNQELFHYDMRAHQRFITRQKDMTSVKYICSKMSAQDTYTQQAPYSRKKPFVSSAAINEE
jgi:hypothetical protein